MKIAELPACPQWLRDARTAGADVGWGRGPGSWIVWHGGEWHGGDWRSGVWHGGVWLGGVWRGGVWLGGEWLGGDWRSGVWHGGDWRSGVWLGGEWLGGDWRSGEWHGGDWRSGVWHGGDWRSGVWRGGVWLGGEWHGGRSACRSPYVPLVTETGAILVGCKEKTSEEWEAWLDGREEYQTKRGTKEFTMIEAHIRATIAYKRTLDALLGKVKP
jgi:hypothetical protein